MNYTILKKNKNGSVRVEFGDGSTAFYDEKSWEHFKTNRIIRDRKNKLQRILCEK